jgi:hypothetical protein
MRSLKKTSNSLKTIGNYKPISITPKNGYISNASKKERQSPYSNIHFMFPAFTPKLSDYKTERLNALIKQ